MTAKSTKSQLRVIASHGIDAVLGPAGFDRVTGRRWCRPCAELSHVIELGHRHGSYTVQWGVVSPELVWFLWGEPPRNEVGYAAMRGTPSSLRQPALASWFSVDEQTDAEFLAVGLAEDMRATEEWLRPFQTRADLRRYLMVNRDPEDNRGFIVPMQLSLKAYTAAALAVVDGAADTDELVLEAIALGLDYDSTDELGRVARLSEAAVKNRA